MQNSSKSHDQRLNFCNPDQARSEDRLQNSAHALWVQLEDKLTKQEKEIDPPKKPTFWGRLRLQLAALLF